ncbi:hypothetical protein OHS59_19490 [Streptomyces sp. NBC_00414]|uniref:hypothetical protein n=1 Tax=Streptomyces sp. NBC_00414 TaxID=2975739 RepID=UPI002E1EB5CE
MTTPSTQPAFEIDFTDLTDAAAERVVRLAVEFGASPKPLSTTGIDLGQILEILEPVRLIAPFALLFANGAKQRRDRERMLILLAASRDGRLSIRDADTGCSWVFPPAEPEAEFLQAVRAQSDVHPDVIRSAKVMMWDSQVHAWQPMQPPTH